MSKANTSPFAVFAAIAIMFTTACQSVRTGQRFSPEQAAVKTLPAGTEAASVAAAQTSTESQPFSASGIYNEATRANAKHVEEAVATNTAAPDSKAAFSTLRDKIKQKQGQMSVAKRLVVNSALRKLEKMQAKKEIRKVEAAKKASGGLGEYKYPVILGAIGLVLVIIGAAAFSTAGAIFYVLGSLALTAAVIWAILILAEVI